ncbi:MAG: tetratricopeptide repeat protein [Gemmatimonadota bacterium]
MNFRLGSAGLLALVLIAGGCASGAGGGPEGMQPQQADEGDMPGWVSALPEGIPPTDSPENAQASLFLAQASGQGDPEAQAQAYQQAIDAARAAIAADSTNAQSYIQLGQAQLGLGNFEEAAASFDQAEELYPRAVWETSFYAEQVWIEEFNRGIEALDAGNNAEAIAAFERAHNIYQERPEAMLQLGTLYEEEGRIDDAVSLYSQAVEVMREPHPMYAEEAELVAGWEERVVPLQFIHGQLLFQAERYDEAAEVYQRLVDENPDDLGAVSSLASALNSAGRQDEAQAIYDELLARPDLDAGQLANVGIGLYNLDQFVTAADAFARAHEQAPPVRDFLFNEAQSLYLAEEQPERLMEVSERLIEMDTHNRDARRFLANALIRMDRSPEAVPVLEEAETLPFDLPILQLAPGPDGTAVLGQAMNLNLDPGTTVNIRFTIYDGQGTALESQDVAVTLGEVEQPVEFQVDFPGDQSAVGFSYEVL